jgi:hypothetical protein
VRHCGSHCLANAGFTGSVQVDALLVRNVLNCGARHPDTAMKAAQQAALCQELHIPSYGLQSDAQPVCQLLDSDRALFLGEGQQP